MSLTARASSLLLVLLLLALHDTAHAVEPPESRVAATGFTIPHADGSPGSWLGAYVVGSRLGYCVDPHRIGSPAAAAHGRRVVARTFRNDRGHLVPSRDLQRAAWILSTAGATSDRDQAAAVDTAVAALLSRAAYAFRATRSEARLRATGHARVIRDLAASLLRRSTQYAGPLRVTVRATPTTLGAALTVTTTVTTQAGRPVPGLTVRTDLAGDGREPTTATTDAHGQLRWHLTPTQAGPARIVSKVLDAPTTWPVLQVPDSKRFQRMALAGLTHQVASTMTVTVARATPAFATAINTTAAHVGDSLHDAITVTGVVPGHPVTFTWTLLGPYATDCTAAPVAATGELTVTSSGTVTTPNVATTGAGHYTYVESSPGTADYAPSATPCGEASETALVSRWVPAVTTVASAQTAQVGVALRDRLIVTGLPPGTRAHVTAYLIGPAATEHDLDCSQRRRHTELTVEGSGTFTTPALTITEPGWYSWVQVLDQTAASDRVVTSCHDDAETTLVTRPAAPVVTIDSGPDTVGARAAAPLPWAHLQVPAVGIDVRAFATAASRGRLPLPDGRGAVAWYDRTARAADAIGRLVLAGHVSTPTGGRGPFGALQAARLGMRVQLTRSGQTRTYEIVAKHYYPRTRQLPATVFNATGPLSLSLVTCAHRITRADGSWHYVDNLVLIARRVS